MEWRHCRRERIDWHWLRWERRIRLWGARGDNNVTAMGGWDVACAKLIQLGLSSSKDYPPKRFEQLSVKVEEIFRKISHMCNVLRQSAGRGVRRLCRIV